MTRVFITGSADGLGRAAAQTLLDEGHEVVVHARSTDRLAAVRDLLDRGAEAVVGDLSDLEQTHELATHVNRLGRMDAVIHNAGVMSGSHVLPVNVVAPYLLTALVERPQRLVYLSSSMHRGGRAEVNAMDWSGRATTGSYSDSKLFVTTLALAVARLWPDVLSNAVDPGWVPTKMGGAGARRAAVPGRTAGRAGSLHRHPLGDTPTGGELMRGAVMYGPGDVRVDEREAPQIVEPTDAIIRVSAACVCGSDLWPYRGVEQMQWPAPMGHEYAGIVEEVGDAVTSVKPGQFVVGSFWATDNTCEICRSGYQSGCVNRVPMGALGAQAEVLRVPLADGTLIATPDLPDDDLVPSLVSASDVLGTGWFGAVAAEAGPGKTVAVVGDGAVGLLAVLAAKQLGAERIIAMSRHESRQRLAREYGATDIIEARGDEGVAAIKELTNGLGAHSIVEAVGTQESMNQAIHAARPGGHVGFVGVAHGVAIDGMDLFWSLAHVHGGPAPVRRFLPELLDLIWNREINPGKVFDLELPLDQAADGYRAMDQRDAIKVLLRP